MILLPLFMSHKVNFISNFNEMSCIMIILFSKYNIKLEIEGKLFISFVFEKWNETLLLVINWSIRVASWVAKLRKT